MVTSPRIASMLREERRSLHTMLGQYKIMNGAGTRDYPTNILEILCGIIIRISAHRS